MEHLQVRLSQPMGFVEHGLAVANTGTTVRHLAASDGLREWEGRVMSKKIIALSACSLFAAFGIGAGVNAAQTSTPVPAVHSYTATMTSSTPATPSTSAPATSVTSVPEVPVGAAQTPVEEPVMPVQPAPEPEPKPTWGYMHYPNWLHPVVVQTCVRDQVSIEECTARSEAYSIELQRKALERTSKATATKPVSE